MRFKVVKNITLILVMVIVYLSLLNTVFSACSGTDSFSLIVREPDSTDISVCPAQTISPTGGDNCNNVDSDSCSQGVRCRRVGTYTAEITCAGCGSHSAISFQDVITCTDQSANQFIINDNLGVIVAFFSAHGYLFLKGDNFTEISSTLSPPAGSFIVKNSTGAIVAYIDSTGELRLKGNITEEQTSLSPPAGSFIVRNSTGTTVSYITNDGSIVLTGSVYELWLDPPF